MTARRVRKFPCWGLSHGFCTVCSEKIVEADDHYRDTDNADYLCKLCAIAASLEEE